MSRFTARPFYSPETEEQRFLPECPRVLRNFAPGDAHLAWVSIQHSASEQRGSLNLLNLRTRRNQNFPLPGRPGFFVETTEPGVLLVGLELSLVLFDLNSARLTETGLTIGDDERVIINDGIAIPGGVLFGTKHLKFDQPVAALYRLDSATRTIHTVFGGQICSNGKYLRHDENGIRLIDIDSLPKSIRCYHFSPDWEPRSQHPVVDPAALPAFPDGLRHTPTGESVVVAFYNPDPVPAGLAQEFAIATGAVLNEWEFPGSPRVTCPEFAEVDGAICLIFTTAVEGMPDALRAGAPEAGTLFIAETPFSQLPDPPPLVGMAP